MSMKISKIIATFLLCVLSTFNIACAQEVSEVSPEQTKGCSIKTVIPKNEVIKLEFAQKFDANKAAVGDKVDFVLSNALIGKSGDVALPKGTVFTGIVEKQVKSKTFNRNARVYIPIKQVKLQSGEVVSLSASVNKKNGELKSPAAGNIPKILLEAGVVVGAGMAVSAVIIAYTVASIFTGGIAAIALLAPVTATTAAIGVLVCSSSKGLNYKAKPGKTIQVVLQDDLELCLN